MDYMTTLTSDLDTLKMVRDKLAEGGDTGYSRDFNYEYFAVIMQSIDALIARMEQAPETPTALVANWMIENGYITGHGDTVADLLNELVEQAWMAAGEKKE